MKVEASGMKQGEREKTQGRNGCMKLAGIFIHVHCLIVLVFEKDGISEDVLNKFLLRLQLSLRHINQRPERVS